MPVKIVRTAERAPYRPLYLSFIEKHFAGDFEVTSFPSWSQSPFFFANFTLNEDGSIGSLANFLLTSEQTYKKVLGEGMKEHEMPPFAPGEYGMPYLYWSTFIVENRLHAPYLIKSIFNEVWDCATQWELMITHVYAIAFTKVSEKLLKRYYFAQSGTYTEHGNSYPIMISKVADNPYLRAFLPKL